MAATRENEDVFADADDDDGMPPLVDIPNPAMTFTFATDMTPITFSSDPSSYQLPSETSGPEMSIYSPPVSPALGPVRVSHTKKRDPSYIPRPPNAFILFRSSFIRAEHIPGKIEGNHSALSKIIGKCWKALSREEREVWEAKAIVAQAEHRKKYPDWRFRPSANALAKVKDGPKRRSRKGRGEAEKEVRSREKRCAKIADLLVAGKTGSALEAAVNAYDFEATFSMKVEEMVSSAANEGAEEGAKGPVRPAAPQVTEPLQVATATDTRVGRVEPTKTRCKTPGAVYDARFKVPLTSMFKRSSSAPAAQSRNNCSYPDDLRRTHSVDGRTAHTTPPPAARMTVQSHIATPALEHEEGTRVGALVGAGTDKALSCSVAATQQPVATLYGPGTLLTHGGSTQWHAAPASSPVMSERWSPPLPAFELDTDVASSPIQSPSPIAFNTSAEVGDLGVPQFLKFGENPCESFHSSYSSLNGWAGDAFMKGDPPFIFSQAADATIMRDAFQAAACAPWPSVVGLSVPQDFSTFPPSNVQGLEGLQYYSEALQSLPRHPDNLSYVF